MVSNVAMNYKRCSKKHSPAPNRDFKTATLITSQLLTAQWKLYWEMTSTCLNWMTPVITSPSQEDASTVTLSKSTSNLSLERTGQEDCRQSLLSTLSTTSKSRSRNCTLSILSSKHLLSIKRKNNSQSLTLIKTSKSILTYSQRMTT